ncbi:MAG: hypothetical protein AAFQ07_11615, partial [Chloroflexota bacterium]
KSYGLDFPTHQINSITLFILSLFASVLFLPTFIAFAIRPQRGTATITGLSIGIIVGMLTPYTWDSILSFSLIGILAESVLLLNDDSTVWNQRYTLIGVMLGVLQFAINIIGHDLELAPMMWLGLLIVTLISGVGIVWTGIYIGQKFKSIITT